ncbi:MAG: hypothetical protein KC516_01250 [Nanoarchaeota archaeon]|nr:hypothetical protein [Nanoarchaeota archaeon]
MTLKGQTEQLEPAYDTRFENILKNPDPKEVIGFLKDINNAPLAIDAAKYYESCVKNSLITKDYQKNLLEDRIKFLKGLISERF